MLSAHHDTESCPKCGSDLALTRGTGRVASFNGVAVAVPATMELLRCHGCGTAYPTLDQAAELHDVVERDLIGYDASGRPVLRGT